MLPNILLFHFLSPPFSPFEGGRMRFFLSIPLMNSKFQFPCLHSLRCSLPLYSGSHLMLIGVTSSLFTSKFAWLVLLRSSLVVRHVSLFRSLLWCLLSSFCSEAPSVLGGSLFFTLCFGACSARSLFALVLARSLNFFSSEIFPENSKNDQLSWTKGWVLQF